MKKQESLINHFIRSIIGAWQLVKLNPRAMDYFDKSAEGFWKSFWAIPLVAPLFFLWVKVSYVKAVELGYRGPIEANVLTFIVGLPLFALVMVLFTRFLKIDTHYSSMVIAYNWLSVVIYFITLPLDLLMRIGPMPINIAVLLTVAVIFYLRIYVTWFMFKQSLQVSSALAIGVLVFEFLFQLSVMAVFLRLFQ
ncbi:MAG: hypothetical protein GXP02_02655 [Alphaproteobacteria bacterium]|nr:hypothetical protein [Alphaproteobacteria bacterium]